MRLGSVVHCIRIAMINKFSYDLLVNENAAPPCVHRNAHSRKGGLKTFEMNRDA